MFKTSDRASFLIIIFGFSSTMSLYGDVFLPFSIGTFIATPSPEKKIAYQTFLALKDLMQLLGVCYV